MLTQDDIDNLDYQLKRLEYGSAEFDRLQDEQSFLHLKNELKNAKYIYESYIGKAEGVEWFQERLNRINAALKKIEDIESKQASSQITSIQTLPSERGVNFSMYPSKKQSQEDRGVTYYFHLKESNTSITGYWNSQCYAAMDFAAELILENENRLINSVEPSEHHLPSPDWDKEENGCRYWVSFTDKEFREATAKKWMQSRDIDDLMKQASQTHVSNLRYGVIKNDEEGKPHYDIGTFDGNFFSYFKKERIDSDGNVIGRKYYFLFDGALGHAFVENVLKKMNDTVQISLYGLPNLTQVLYRKFILTSASQKIQLKTDTVIKGLNLTDRNRNHQVKQIKEMVDELLREHFISSYEPKDISSLTKKFEVVRSDIKGQKIKQIKGKGSKKGEVKIG